MFYSCDWEGWPTVDTSPGFSVDYYRRKYLLLWGEGFLEGDLLLFITYFASIRYLHEGSLEALSLLLDVFV